MGLLARIARRSPDELEAADSAAPSVEALAGLIRVFGQYAFPIGDGPPEALAQRCEAWARHLLVGAPAPVGNELPTASSATEPGMRRAYADLARFFTARRRTERNFVRDSISELRGAILDVVNDLVKAAGDDTSDDASISAELDALITVAENESAAELRARISKTVRAVSRTIETRRKRHEAQIGRLGQTLSEVRASLVDAKNESNSDALTGLRNRRALDADLERHVTLSRLSSESLSVVMLDIDHFKRINDTLGHAGGDVVIRAVADALIRAFPRKTDYVARYGGEEFTLVLPSSNAPDSLRLVERFLASLRALVVVHEGVQVSVTCSAGIAELSREEDAAALVARADAALYRAKRDGRDRALLA